MNVRKLFCTTKVSFKSVERGASKCSGDGLCTVNTTSGPVRGRVVESSVRLTKYLAFQGIPYGRPPLGKLRFRAPQPVRPWGLVRDTLAERPPCPQFDFFTGHLSGSEDCLYHNVFVPGRRVEGPPKAVMVWLSGTGSCPTSLYGPDHFMTQNVVLVTLNFRVGPFGFLSMQNSLVPGNCGLKDQIAVLQWINDNIRNFGGDPNNVTVFGQGLGAVCAHLLTLTPLTRNLVHRIICQSGCALVPWGVKKQQEALDQTHQLAFALGCKSSQSDEVMEVLQSAPSTDIVQKQFCRSLLECHFQKTFRPLPFIPAIEPPAADEKVVFSVDPEFILSQHLYSPVPCMFGVNATEGAMTHLGVKGNPGIDRSFNSGSDCLRFIDPFCTIVTPTRHMRTACEQIHYYYSGVPRSPASAILDISADINVNYPMVQAVKYAARTSVPIFVYNFLFDGEWGCYKKHVGLQRRGACHLDEVFYLFFTSSLPFIDPESIEVVTMKRLTQMWASFSKVGDPTPPSHCVSGSWSPYTARDPWYMEIDKTLRMRRGLKRNMVQFWSGVYNHIETTRESIPTYQ